MKQRLLHFFVIPLMVISLLFCGCDGGDGITYTTETDRHGNIVTVAAAGELQEGAVITSLADRETSDESAYITGLKTYQVKPLDEAVPSDLTWVRFVYADADGIKIGAIKGLDLVLFNLDREGNVVSQRLIPESDVKGEHPMYGCVLPDDGLLAVYCLSGRTQGVMRRYDAAGTLLYTAELPEEVQANANEFEAHVTEADDGGYRIVMRFMGSIVAVDETLTVQSCYVSERYQMAQLSYRGDGIYHISTYNNQMIRFDAVSGETEVFRLPQQETFSGYYDFCYDMQGNLYCGDSEGIYRVPEDGTQPIPVLQWLNGTARSSSRNIILDETTVLSLQRREFSSSSEFVILDCAHEERFSAPRRIIEIGILDGVNKFRRNEEGFSEKKAHAAGGTFTILQEAIAIFNSESDRYYAVLRDYGKYRDAMEMFKSDMLTGNAPDMILYGCDEDLSIYTEKNLMVDLLPFFGDRLLGGARDAMLRTGALWSLPFVMHLQTYTTSDPAIGGALTYSDFYTLKNGLSGRDDTPEYTLYPETETIRLHGGITTVTTPRDDIPFTGEVITGSHDSIQHIYQRGIFDFVDYTAKEAHFDTEAFCDFIRALAEIDRDFVHTGAGGLITDPSTTILEYMMSTSYLPENLEQGRLKLLSVDFESLGAYAALKRVYGDGTIPFTLCGYPAAAGHGAGIYVPTAMAVLAQSEVHGGCAAFIDFLLSDRVQTSEAVVGDYLPVTLSAMAAAIDGQRYFYYSKNLPNPLYPFDVSAQPLEQYKDIAPGGDITVIEITDEDKSAMLAFFEDCRMYANADPVITEIVNEELSYWHGGARTLEETAKIIQSRVWIYLNE